MLLIVIRGTFLCCLDLIHFADITYNTGLEQDCFYTVVFLPSLKNLKSFHTANLYNPVAWLEKWFIMKQSK